MTLIDSGSVGEGFVVLQRFEVPFSYVFLNFPCFDSDLQFLDSSVPMWSLLFWWWEITETRARVPVHINRTEFSDEMLD